MTSAKGVLLDVDGTLVDSNDAHAHAYVDALKEFGYDVPFERVRPLIGMGGDELLPELIGVAGDSKVRQDIDARCSEVFNTRYLPEISAFPGVRALLERFAEDGLSLIAASSSEKTRWRRCSSSPVSATYSASRPPRATPTRQNHIPTS